MKPLLCLVAVGSVYNKYILSSIEKLSKKYDLCILTDSNIRIYGAFDVEIYKEKIFTYFAKLTFTTRMAIKHKRGAIYCDINKLHELDNLVVTDKYKFTYLREWPKLIYFQQMEDEMYWRKLVWFWLNKGYEYKQLKTIEEHCFYMPYHRQSDILLYKIEEIKPIFEYISTMEKHPYNGIGNGEGLALSYALDVVGVDKARVVELVDTLDLKSNEQ